MKVIYVIRGGALPFSGPLSIDRPWATRCAGYVLGEWGPIRRGSKRNAIHFGFQDETTIRQEPMVNGRKNRDFSSTFLYLTRVSVPAACFWIPGQAPGFDYAGGLCGLFSDTRTGSWVWSRRLSLRVVVLPVTSWSDEQSGAPSSTGA